jgi:nucleotide-binding universal stress UspA family protein
MMIKDVMVRLEGGAGDEIRLAAVKTIAQRFESHVIALYFNVLPLIIPSEGEDLAAIHTVELIEMARKAGDKTEAALARKLSQLQFPVELRRFDVFSDALPDIATREARAADEFVGIRPNGAPSEPERMIESVLFGGGRHLMLVPDGQTHRHSFDHILIAWNGSREAARAMAEAMPYIHGAKSVTVVVVDDGPPVEERALLGQDAVTHLRHHGIDATLHHVTGNSREAGATIIGEARRTQADLIVMGGYGHSRLREVLLGGVTRELMHNAPVPLLMAH